jgi:hypothetical protein
MLSHAEQSICVFGDSHIACIKHALDENRVSVPFGRLEFWGASGPSFRGIHLKDRRLQPLTEDAQEQVKMISGTGRGSLAPEDFDVFLFVGSRLRAQSYIVPMLWRAQDEAGYLSQAVRDAVLERWLTGCRSYRAARAFAASGKTRVFFAPASFMNDQVLDEKVVARSINQQATAAERSALWEGVAQRMDRDGITLIAQPEQTVTRGCLTRIEYASSRAIELQDPVHKNGAFGALILKAMFAQLAEDTAAASPHVDVSV